MDSSVLKFSARSSRPADGGVLREVSGSGALYFFSDVSVGLVDFMDWTLLTISCLLARGKEEDVTEGRMLAWLCSQVRGVRSSCFSWQHQYFSTELSVLSY